MMQVDEMHRLSAGSAATTWPLAAPAQQPTMPVIGYVGAQSPAAFAHRVRAFRQGLGETGSGDGRNVAIEFRWAEGQHNRLSALAADLAGPSGGRDCRARRRSCRARGRMALSGSPN
jgi:hypothetical protein